MGACDTKCLAMSEQPNNLQSQRVTLKELGVDYLVHGACPVQAEGMIQGRHFCFRAKHSNWTFEVANDLGEFPSDIGGNAVFILDSRHNDAGDMPLSEANRIIEACVRLYLEVTVRRLKVLGS